MKRFSIYSVMMIAVLLCAGRISAQLPSFPGAEGAGSLTSGGRGTLAVPTRVYAVTTLYDSLMPGSLRYALAQTATSRTIVFNVSGTIHLKSALKITKANTTIAGQTAPGGGICLADYPVSVNANNIILRYLRFRLGDKNQNLGMVNGSGDGDALDGTGYKNIIVDHCSMSWSNDESCTFYRGDSLTLQWNIVAEPLNYSYHFETGDVDYEQHAFVGIWGGQHASFHHNLLAHAKGRMPRFDGSRNLPPYTAGMENADFRNNVIYNWGSYSTNGGEGGNYNIVNNYYKYGPSTPTSSSSGVPIRAMIINPYKQTSTPVLPYGKYFMDGNYVDGNTTITADNWRGAAMSGGSLADTATSKVATAFASMAVTTWTPAMTYDSVLANAGAIRPLRDSVDMRVVNDVMNRTGALIDVQGGFPHGTAYAATTGAWPVLISTPALADDDKDGMPNSWELNNGSNPNDSTDRQTVAVNGYTNLENYLNNIGLVDTTTPPPPPPPPPTAVNNVNGIGSEIKAYPNPASGTLNLSFPIAQEGAMMAVYTTTGAIVNTYYVPKGLAAKSIVVSAFAPGIYYLQYHNANQQWTVSFIKE